MRFTLLLLSALAALSTFSGCGGTLPLVATEAVAEKFVSAVGQKTTVAGVPVTGGGGGLNATAGTTGQYCSNQARVEGANDQQISQVCTGAFTPSPAVCLRQATAQGLSKDESATLCANSVSDAPADCARMATSFGFSRNDSVKLCSQSPTEAPAACARQATTHLFTPVEAIQLCAGAYSEDPAYCAQKLKFEGKADSVAVKTCSAK